MTRDRLRQIGIRVAIVLAPSYTAAAMTGKMVWVVPTLVAASLVATAMKFDDEEETAVRVDEDGSDGDGDTGL